MTNIAILPQISGSFIVATNGDWRDVIAFFEPAPNQTTPLDLTGIAFTAQARTAATDPNVILNMSTSNGLLVNGGAAGTLTWAVPTLRPSVAPYDCTSKLVGQTTLVMDVIATADGQQINVFEKAGPATITINPGVTR